MLGASRRKRSRQGLTFDFVPQESHGPVDMMQGTALNAIYGVVP